MEIQRFRSCFIVWTIYFRGEKGIEHRVITLKSKHYEKIAHKNREPAP